MDVPAAIVFIMCVFFNFDYSSAKISVKKLQSWKNIGFLSQGNYETVHHLIAHATPVIVKHQEDLYQLIENGTVDAGLISGVPDETRFVVYPSGSISPRGMFTRPRKSNNKNAIRQLVDAAIVRLQANGKLEEFALKNAPFEFVEVHTCRTNNVEKYFPFPNISSFTSENSSKHVIRVGALGPYDWKTDGNYVANPPTGFWPDVLNELDNIMGNNYTLVRIFYPTSTGVMDALQNEEVDVTEPYWTVDSFYKDLPRTWSFDHGCTTLGYESNFFEKRISDPIPAETNSQMEITLAIVIVVILIIAVLIIGFLVFREKRGQPVFMELSGANAPTNQNSNEGKKEITA